MATKEKEQDLSQDIPTEFPADQLFVAVSEGMGEYAGDDGGGMTGGRGLWAKGIVGEWTSNRPVPIALRDPDTGLIWKGYLEPVTQTAYGVNGVLIPTDTQKFWVSPDESPHVPKQPKIVKATAPTEKAVKRAKSGPTPMNKSVKASPLRPASPLAVSANTRASDSQVG